MNTTMTILAANAVRLLTAKIKTAPLTSRLGAAMSVTKTELEKFKTRWRRWLGQVTRFDKPTWTKLLKADWMAWPDRVLSEQDINYTHHGLNYMASPEEIKMLFARAIDVATMTHLVMLDGLYATERVEKLMRR